jgi:serine/threonine-protein kinase
MDLSGAIIGQYRIIEQVDRGGMATVYKAYQSNLDRYVAVKVLIPDLAEAKGFIARFEREAKAVARLRHRNILTVFDYGRQGEMFYLVMEYVSGGTLGGRLGWPQDLTYAVSIVSQVGDALAYAHRQGMIHRDVKPGNILMVEEDWPLLSDFGVAKMVEDSLQLTASGATVGTPQYMSPEQAQGLTVDRRSDIYSLGVVLYEAVTGRLPFGTDSPMAVILRHINEPITPPHTLRSDLPKELERTILKALSKSPDGRYQRMEEFLADLQEAYPLSVNHLVHQGNMRAGSKGLPAIHGPVSTPIITPRLPGTRKRSSPWAGLAIGLVLLLTLALTFLLFKDSIGTLVSSLADAVAMLPSPSTVLRTGPSPTPKTDSSPTPRTSPSAVPTTSPSAVPTTSPSAVPRTSPSATLRTGPSAVPTTSPSATPRTGPSPTPSTGPSAATPSPTVAPTTPAPPTIELRMWEADGAEMVFVPAGEFVMGSEELGDDERPVRRVYLDDFWIDRYEVTNERFARFVAETGYQTEAETEDRGRGWVWMGSEWEEVEGANWRHPRGPDSNSEQGIEDKMDHPVVLVSWNDADAYCRWAGKRLPSEAQWEKAARGPANLSSTSQQVGDSGQRYAWGDEFDSAKTNTKERWRMEDGELWGDTTPAGSFSPQGDSPYGASDMTGNVWEWVADWYDSDYYSQAPSANPPGPATGTYKVLRGGSWSFDEVYARTAFRHNIKPDYIYDFAGFRCSSQ